MIDDNCDSCYSIKNDGSILKEVIRLEMSRRLHREINDGLLTIIDYPCKCVHRFGCVPKGVEDFRIVMDCSAPKQECVNDHTSSCVSKFIYNSVDMVTRLLQQGDYMSIGQ